MKALIMAGGKGERIGYRHKPLLKFLGKEMISYAIEALEKCGEIEKIYVAARKGDEKLTRFLKNKKTEKKLEIIITEGRGYVEDLREIAKKRAHIGKAVVVSCDIPLINEKILRKLIKEYSSRGKPSAAVYLPLKIFNELKIEPTMIFDNTDNELSIVPAGINFTDFSNLNAEEEKIVVSFRELAFNINTMKELKKAEKYAKLLQNRR